MTQRNILLGLSLLGAVGINSYAVSFRLPNQDPEAIARGNAFAATANNPSAIYYNPAGITQLEGHQVSLGLYAVSAGTKYTGAGGTAETDDMFQPVPQIYYTFSPKDSQLSYGLGIYAPYGLGVDWGRKTPFRFVGEKGKVLYASVNPVIAWQPHETFSIGIGPTLNYSDASLEQSLPVPGLDQFKFKGDGFDFGFNAGLLWQPIKQLSFGVNYRHQTTINYHGDSEFTPLPKTKTEASLRYPQFVVFGVSYRPTENWNFEFNVDWTDWDNVNSTTFHGARFPAGLVFDHQSTFMYEFGVTRQLPKNYFVSVGYFYSENSVPDATFNPLIPDSNLHLGSIGFGHKGERWDWAFAYHFGYNGDGRVVSGSPFGGLADGRYETLNHGLNASVVFKF